MKKTKVNGFCLLLLVICILMFEACGADLNNDGKGKLAGTDSIKAGQKNITLKLWHIWSADSESNKRPFERALDKWNDAYPEIKIEAEATENETYKTRIRTAIAVNEAPDIFYCWGAGFAKPFIEAKKILPLDEYLNDGTREKLDPRSLNYFTYDGKLYALPIYMITGIFYCNKELFDKNGIKIPGTYTELLEAVKKFNEKGITPMAVGEKDRWPGMFYQNILAIRTAGTKLCNQALDKKESFNRPEFVESAARLSELVKAGAFDKNCMSMTRDEAEAEFRKGKVAMYYNGSWVAGSLESEDSPVKGKIVVRNFPVIANSKGDADGFVGGAIDTFMISGNTKYKEEAVKALKYIDEAFCKESYLAGASLPAWKIDVDESKINPLSVEISKLVKGATGFVLAWDTYLSGTDQEIHKDLVAEIFAGSKTPEEFANEMQKLNEK